jgi:two-component system NtrC family sensor kinase
MTNRIDAEHIQSPLSSIDVHRDHAYFRQLKNKLRSKLLVAYVTPLLALSVYFHYQYNQSLQQGIDNHLRSLAENQRNTVDLFLKERVANVRNVLQSSSWSTPGAAQRLDEALIELQRDSETFVDLGLFDPAGTLVAYAGPHSSLVGRDYSGEHWFQNLHTSSRATYISDVYMGFRDQPHFIIAAAREIDALVWTLRASVDPKEFASFVSSSYLLENAEAFIVNAQGQRQTFTLAAATQVEPSYVPEHSANTLLTEVTVGGVRYARALAWLTETDWALVVRVPTKDAYAPMQRARFILVAIMVVTLLLIVAVVRRSTHNLVGLLETTTEAKEDLTLQLFNAAKLASVGEMAAGVAHEINNPLAIVYEEASMMKDLLDPQFSKGFEIDEFRERLDAIREATMRGRDITRKLMAFARQHEPEPESTDLNQVVDRVLKVKENEFRVSDVSVSTELSVPLPCVCIGRNQMDQVLLNLLNNAKDAMDHAGRIRVRTFVDGKWVCIEVGDSGCGMSADVMDRIFFPFFTTKTVGKGTGLGLSISYGIVKSLGGRIEVQSTVGEGTTFTISLPAAKNVAAPEAARGES